MTTPQGGLTLHDAARAMGVIFTTEASPTDREVQVNGINIHYLDWCNDDKPPMLLLHGRTNSAHTWDFTSLAFHDSFHVMVPDQRGHGESGWAPDADYGLDGLVPDIQRFVDALGLKDVTLVGHSMGGRAALAYASENTDLLKALVVLDMAPQVERNEIDSIAGWRRLPAETDSFEEFVEAAHNVNPRRTVEQLRGSLAHQLRQYESGKWSWKWDPALRQADTSGWTNERLWEAVSNIRCPVLMIRGGQSGLVSDATIERMKEVVPGTQAVEIEGAGHQVAGDKPALVQQAMRDFFAAI